VTKRRNQKQQQKLDGKASKSAAANKKRPSDAKTDTLTAEEGEQDISGEENDNSNSDPSFIGGFSKKKQ
jgi:hypothetical protein